MSLALLQEHRAVWASKPVLAQVYRVWFDALLDGVPAGSTVLEVGAGPGFLKERARERPSPVRVFSSDLLPVLWNDLAADALRLPFRAACLGAVIGVDVLHHLARPAAFFAEAARVLRAGGTLGLVEPWVTPLSFPIYRWLHQEGCRLGLDPWDPFGAGEAKDAFEGDAAVVFKMVRETDASRWRSLGFSAPRVRILNAFAYLLSLGFKRGSLLPRPAAPWLLRLDRRLEPLAPWLGLRALAVWERRG
jgi:SAM-dependent methyltransferase